MFPQGHVKNIVLADDDDDDCLLFQDVVSDLKINANITIARNGQEVLQLLLDESNAIPDLIFLDMNMPLRDGMECLKEVRKSRRLKKVPVIILSTSSHAQTVQDVFDEGANLFIRKPDAFNKLRTIMARIISQTWPEIPQREGFLITE
jgi:CheY-like chemotaxis protein